MHFINKNSRWLILAILLIGWFLMTWELGRDSLWQNEIVSFSRATQPTITETYTEIANDDSAPLYEMIFLRPWLLLGTQEFWHRLPSAFFSILAIAILFRFCIDFANRQVALYAAAIYMLNPIQLYYAREGRMYALLAIATIAWIYFLYRTLKTEGKQGRPFIWYAIFAATSVYAHYYGGITLISASLFVVGYLVKSRNFEYGKRWVLANIGAALLFLPWMSTFFFQLSNDPISSLNAPTTATFGKIFGRFLTGFYYLPGWMEWLISAGVLGVILIGLFLVFFQSNTPRQQPRLMVFLAIIFFSSITIAFVLSKLITPMFVIRYFSGIIPVLIILIVFAISRLNINLIIHGGLGLFVIASLIFAQFTISTVWRKDYRSAFELISQHDQSAQENAVLFYSPGGKFWLDEFEHYYHLSYPVTFMTNKTVADTDLEMVLDQLEENDGVWVIQADQSHLVSDIELATNDRLVSFDQNYFSRFFTHSRTLRISYIEPVE